MNRLYKDHYKNWVAETVIMLSDTIQLKVYTKKSSGQQVVTHASCGHVKDGCVTHVVFDDYTKRCAAECYPRTTSKVVQAQHNSVDIDAIVKDARDFYKIT